MSATMAQFDAFINPIQSARRAYPFIVTLQAEVAQNALEQIVAPLVPVELMPKMAGRLTPIVSIEGVLHAVLVPALTGIRARDLPQRHCSVAAARGELLAAIDYLFFGV
jgi:toxin CcdB